MSENIFAFTEYNPEQPSYPGYVSINRNDTGDVVVSVRAAPYVVDGVYICSHQPGPGKCVKGGLACNNYCNMAPEKGPMQDSPLPCKQVYEGAQASFTVHAENWTLGD